MILDVWVFFETVEKVQVSLNYEKNIGPSARRAIWMYDNISPNSSQDKQYFGQISIENKLPI
jgi:hypothetical protein